MVSQYQEEANGIFLNANGIAMVCDEDLDSVIKAALTLDRPSLLEDAAEVALHMLPVDASDELCRKLAGKDINSWFNG